MKSFLYATFYFVYLWTLHYLFLPVFCSYPVRPLPDGTQFMIPMLHANVITGEYLTGTLLKHDNTGQFLGSAHQTGVGANGVPVDEHHIAINSILTREVKVYQNDTPYSLLWT